MLDLLARTTKIEKIKIAEFPLTLRDFVVKVDRTTRSRCAYPKGMKPVHPELSLTGPPEYNIKTLKVETYKRKSLREDVRIIYNQLRQNNVLESCLGLTDLLAIEKKGSFAFYKAFGNKKLYVYGLKSLCEDSEHQLRVPVLTSSCYGGLFLFWERFDFSQKDISIAYFSKP
ncbi:MAG: hypothetical protein WC662_00365 [Candidatus Paceibacterota bacterium]